MRRYLFVALVALLGCPSDPDGDGTTSASAPGGGGTGGTGGTGGPGGSDGGGAGAGLPAEQSIALTLFVVKRHDVCIVGEPCPEAATCTRVYNDEKTIAFANSSVKAVPPDDAAVATAEQSICLSLRITDVDLGEISAAAAEVEANVSAWTAGALKLAIAVVPIDQASLPLTPLEQGFWLGPWDVPSALSPLVTTATDGTLITTGLYDPDQDLRVDSPLCGGTLGADWGLAGAGYSWIPRINGLWYECTDRGVYTHEWLHQVEFNLWHMTPDRSEAYWNESDSTHSFPACGAVELDPRAWFPSTHDCAVDPDSPDCGANDCSGNDAVNEHVLAAHWNPAVTMVANHCRDGLKNYDETGIDMGGKCGAMKIGESAAAARPVPKWRSRPPRSG